MPCQAGLKFIRIGSNGTQGVPERRVGRLKEIEVKIGSRKRAHKASLSRFVVVDGHRVMREATARWLSDCPQWRVCAQAGSAASAIRAIARTRPHLLVTELMPPRNLEFISTVRRRFPKLVILVFSAMDETWLSTHARAVGANAFVSKESGPEKLLRKVRRLLHTASPPSRRQPRRLS